MDAPELHELEDIKYVTVVDEIHIQIVAMGHKNEKYYQYMIGVIPTNSRDGLVEALNNIDIGAIATTIAGDEMQNTIMGIGS